MKLTIKYPLKANRPIAEKLKFQNSSQAAFTLIEMLVVIFIVAIGLVGAISFFNINLNNQFEAKNELIAAGLAQEGADLVRNIRDYNLLKGNAWDQGLASCDAVSIDFNSLSGHTCTSNTAVCTDSNRRYCQCGGSCTNSTNFTRTINVSSPDSNSKKITCTVTWKGRITQAIDYLYNNKF